MQERHERTDENVNQAFKDLDALIEKVTKISDSPLTLIFEDGQKFLIFFNVFLT